MSDRRALALFEAALDQPTDRRAEFLRAAAASDPDLLRQAESLLRAHGDSDGFLEPVTAAPPATLGPYRLIECLGSGGMGQVWRAERSDGAFEQQVAIKVLANAFADPETVRRALAERQFMARLQHPHIARILDGGATPDGKPYVVMEYIDGERIDAWCASHSLDLAARVRLFGQVLDAVDAAHRALIIHRDLKPANVLVARDGTVKLLDFGIAKSLDGSIGASETRTGTGPLTPQYASPEQLAGQPLTTACDIYLLGLLLFELVSGRRPFETTGLSIAEITERLSNTLPPRASTRVDPEQLALSPRNVVAWRRHLDGDLDRVLQKALAFEPGRRYRSAGEFADDLARWLDHRPVLARAGGWGYRLGKFVRRHRLAVAAGSAAALALMLGLALALREAELKRAEGERARRSNEFLLELIAGADPFQSGKSPTLLEAVERAEREIPHRYAGQPELEADLRLAIGRAYYGLNRLDGAERNLARALALRPRELGPPYAVVLTALADVDWSRANYVLAEQRYREARALLANAGPDALPALVDASSSLGNLVADLDRGGEALAIADENLRLIEANPALGEQVRGKLLGNRAYALHGLKRLDEAAAAYAAARAELERHLPPVHPDLAINLNNHAMVLRDLGRKPEAAALLERSVAMRREIFGGEHWMLATSLTNLAVLKLETGAADDAQRLITEAISNAEHKVDPKDPILARVHETAARIALARGDRTAAQSEAEHTLALLAKLDPPQPDIRQRAEATLAAVRAH